MKTQQFGTRVRRDFLTLFILYIIFAIILLTGNQIEILTICIIGFECGIFLSGYILAKKQLKIAGYIGVCISVISIITSIINLNIIGIFDTIITGSLLLHSIRYLKNYDNQEQYN